MHVRIIPTSKRARERVKQHGEIFVFKREGFIESVRAVLVDSVERTGFRVEGEPTIWTGWFNEVEARWEKADEQPDETND